MNWELLVITGAGHVALSSRHLRPLLWWLIATMLDVHIALDMNALG